MKHIFIILTCAMGVISTQAQAVTLSYFGTNYSDTGYISSAEPCCEDGYNLRGAYTESQSARVDLRIEGELEADKNYALSNSPIFLPDALSIDLIRAFDGINEFLPQDVSGYFRTDSTGGIFEWFFSALSGTSPDFNSLTISSATGSLAEYSFEYEVEVQSQDGGSFFTTGVERASAVTSGAGQWQVTPVPLPAGGALLLFAAFGLFGIRRVSF